MLESSVKVYNFEVADNHTYLVGESGGVVVHNKACWIKKDAKHAIVYNAPGGKPVTAYQQLNGKYFAEDITSHGGSVLKILEKHGSKHLKLLGDADIEGKLIVNKHSSQAGELFKIIRKLF